MTIRARRMHAVLHLVLLVIRIYIWLLIAQAILSWLLAFGVINRYNRAVSVIGDFLYRVTEPALRPYCALKLFSSTLISCNACGGG